MVYILLPLSLGLSRAATHAPFQEILPHIPPSHPPAMGRQHMPVQRRGQWRQSPGLWQRLEDRALPTCLPGKWRAQMLRKVMDRTCQNNRLTSWLAWWGRGLRGPSDPRLPSRPHWMQGLGLGSPEGEVGNSKRTEPVAALLGLLRASPLLV